MMAVRDDGGFVGHHVDECVYVGLDVDGVEPVPYSVVVEEVDCRRLCGGCVYNTFGDIFGVVIKHEYLAELGIGCAH